MTKRLAAVLLPLVLLSAAPPARPDASPLEVGFAQAEITPKVDAKSKKPVYLAGFGNNRKATGVNDPLFARAAVLSDGKTKIALVSVDLVGFFHGNVENVRKALPGFDYVLVSSTHNHEGPDTLGLWGPKRLESGVDPDYLALVEKKIVESVKSADKNRKAVTARIGSVAEPDLVHDSRLPIVKHDELVALHFRDARTKKNAGLIVQWNCHPETFGSKNTLVSADFVGYTCSYLTKKMDYPVLYLTGTVGGLLSSLGVVVKNDRGEPLENGTLEKTKRYGELVGEAAERALKKSKPLSLTPFTVRSKSVYLPMDNQLYLAGRMVGLFDRECYLWKDGMDKGEPVKKIDPKKRHAIRTEVAYLRLGDLEVASIPGEIYPELVLDKVVDPPEEGADFPDAPIEPAIYKQMKGPYRMMIGLANDEVGYVIPKRQWDEKPPYCYKLKKPQYGEENSLGPDTAPLLCKAFEELAKGK
jgi:hypothetical protein